MLENQYWFYEPKFITNESAKEAFYGNSNNEFGESGYKDEVLFVDYVYDTFDNNKLIDMFPHSNVKLDSFPFEMNAWKSLVAHHTRLQAAWNLIMCQSVYLKMDEYVINSYQIEIDDTLPDNIIIIYSGNHPRGNVRCGCLYKDNEKFCIRPSDISIYGRILVIGDVSDRFGDRK